MGPSPSSSTTLTAAIEHHSYHHHHQRIEAHHPYLSSPIKQRLHTFPLSPANYILPHPKRKSMTTAAKSVHFDPTLDSKSQSKEDWDETRITGYLADCIARRQKGEMLALTDIIRAFDQSSSSNLSRQALVKWINSLSAVVSSLSPACSSLVDVVLNLDWSIISADDNLVSTFRHFIGNLVSAHAFYTRPVLVRIVKLFLVFVDQAEAETQARLSTKFDQLHDILESVLRLIPSASSVLTPLLSEYFPHKSLPTQSQTWYFKNILRIGTYQPIVRDAVWALAIDRVTQIDVEIQTSLDNFSADEFEVFEQSCLDPTGAEESHIPPESYATAGRVASENILSPDDVVFHCDDESDFGSEGSELPAQVNKEKIEEMRNWIVKLDSILFLLLLHLRDTINKMIDQPGVLSHDGKMFLDNLLRSFERTLLTTHKSRFSQFLLFYACSTTSYCTERFLVLLAQKTFTSSTSGVTRISACSYLSSFLARAKFLDRTAILNCIKMMNKWSIRYVEEHENDSLPSDIGSSTVQHLEVIKRHEIFYSIVQALLYVFCFRWRDILNVNDAILKHPDALNQLPAEMTGFQRIMFSKFSPFKVCSKSIVNEFARITHKLDLLYCYALVTPKPVEGELPSSPPTQIQPHQTAGATNVELQSADLIDDFFPFDPCQLPATSKFFTEIFNEWEGDGDAEESNQDSYISEREMSYRSGMSFGSPRRMVPANNRKWEDDTEIEFLSSSLEAMSASYE